ncbi:MAG: Flp pilus assembly complex ATPase component TadA [Clostridiales bacterium]|nr:Flp pilus assembly complex ATPase component TadA [Clostridiales bacterium]
MKIMDLILSIIFLTGMAITIYFIFKEKVEPDEYNGKNNSLDEICRSFRTTINEIINMDLDALNLNKKDLENRRKLKRSLSNAIRKCSQGDMNAKIIVLARAKHTILNIMKVNQDNIDDIIPFNKKEKLTAKDKFEIMLYLQKLKRNQRMFQGICEATKLDRLYKDSDGYYYCITEENIHEAYDHNIHSLSFDDKLNILAQRIYEETYGLSVVDMLIMEDISLDSVSAGVSGMTNNSFRYTEDEILMDQPRRASTHDSIWVVYQGKPIHLKFLSFDSPATMSRICKNLAEHGRMGHLTSAEGGIRTHLADGSRVTVFRPNNALQWAFFVRKFANTASFELKDLITDQGSRYPIELIKWAIHGCVNLFFSGDQNSGKTTYTRAAVREIDKRQPIRTLEADFELYLNNAYSGKNILATRPSERLPFPKLIELLKSSEAHTILFGETASLEHAKHLINLLLAGTKRIITTGHWPTSDDLLSYFVHSLGGYDNGSSTNIQSMVARLIHLDIHCVKDNDGHRHIDRITEIIPYDSDERAPNGEQGVIGQLGEISHYLKQLARKKTYYTRDIIIYKDGRYRMINPISDGLAQIILHNLPPDMRQGFLEFNTVIEGGVVEAG